MKWDESTLGLLAIVRYWKTTERGCTPDASTYERGGRDQPFGRTVLHLDTNLATGNARKKEIHEWKRRREEM